MKTFLDFLTLHKSAIEGAGTIIFGWLIRETPVVYTALKTNGGIYGFWYVIWHGENKPFIKPLQASQSQPGQQSNSTQK